MLEIARIYELLAKRADLAAAPPPLLS